MRKRLTIAFLSSGLLAGIFWWYQHRPHQLVEFPEKTWQVAYLPAFQFQVKDIEASYSLLISMDIDSNIYPYQNLWITYYLEDEQGNLINSQRVNYALFDKKTGRPRYSGILQKHQLLIAPPSIDKNTTAGFRFPKPGMYKIRIEQFMREKSLAGVNSIKFSLENM